MQRWLPSALLLPGLLAAAAVPPENSWTDLLAGGSLAAWRAAGSDAAPGAGWSLHEGVLTLARSNHPNARAGGDMLTRARYGDFEFEAEVRLTPGSNSGIKFHVQPDLSVPDPSTGGTRRLGQAVGPEFQLLDDERHPDARNGRDGNRKFGSLYDLIPAAADKIVHPPGEWNQVRIVARGALVEFWLNGRQTLAYDRRSQAFRDLVARSKYRDIPDFAAWADGHLLLQDHGDEVSFRNVRLRVPPPATSKP